MADEHLQAWFDARTDEQRRVLTEALGTFPLPAPAIAILFETRCPALPVGASWTSNQDGYSFEMPDEVAALLKHGEEA